MQPLLGTFVEIGVTQFQQNYTSEELAEEYKQSVISRAFSKIALIHNLLSFQKIDSELSRLNLSKGKPIKVHRHTRRVISLAKHICKQSSHLFNPTIAGTLVDTKKLPNHGFEVFSDAGDEADIVINGEYVSLLNNCLLTLDGIAKGYAVDCATISLKHSGVLSGWVNAGGDLRVFGDTGLPIVQRQINNELTSLGQFHNCATASSAYGENLPENYSGHVVNGQFLKRFPAVTKDKKGSVATIVARKAWLADALTKVALLADNESKDQIISSLGGRIIHPPQQV